MIELPECGTMPETLTAWCGQSFPYDRVVCTASVRMIPRAWIDQTRPGGVIITPWGTDYGDGALTRLEVQEDRSASRRWGINLGFRRVRNQRRTFLEPTADELSAAETTWTTRTGRELFEIVAFSQAAPSCGTAHTMCGSTRPTANGVGP